MQNKLRNNFLIFGLVTLCLIIGVQLLYIPEFAFLKGHGSYLTPHYLSVSANLFESDGQLCNSLVEGVCDSYHRHPPLYFIVNNIIYFLTNGNPGDYIASARSVSMAFFVTGALLISYSVSDLFKYRVLSVFVFFSTPSFFIYSTLSSFDAVLFLVIGMAYLGFKKGSNLLVLLSIFIGVLTSWYLMIFSSFIAIYAYFQKRNYIYLIALASSSMILALFLLIGIDALLQNLEAAMLNVDQSKTSLQARIIPFELTVKKFVDAFLGSTPFIIYLVAFFYIFKEKIKFHHSKKVFCDVSVVAIISTATFLVWLIPFFRWSLFHNFIFLLLTPMLVELLIKFWSHIELALKPRNYLYVLSTAVLVSIFNYVSFLGAADDYRLQTLENMGIESFEISVVKSYERIIND